MTWAFIAPGLRPRKGLRIRSNKITGRRVACERGYRKESSWAAMYYTWP